MRFSGDDLDPDEISSALCVQPDQGVRKGDVWHTPKGRPVTARTGMWHLGVPHRSPADLDEQIDRLLELATSDLTVWRSLAMRYNGHIFAGLFLSASNQGSTISSQNMLAMGLRGLSIELDIYHLGDDEDGNREV